MQIALHWIIAVLVVIQLLLGDEISAAYDDVRRGWTVSVIRFFWGTVHYYNGLVILGLVLLRLVLRLFQGTPAPAQRGWMHIAAIFSHTAFYLMLIVMPVLGWFAYRHPHDAYGDLHDLGGSLLIALIGVHAAAALFHQFWLKDGPLRRMLA